jgi:hypothetical protein
MKDHTSWQDTCSKIKLINKNMLAELENVEDNFSLSVLPGGDDEELEKDDDWTDIDDEDYEDELEDDNDLSEIRAADDLGEPDPEDDDHLPDDDLQ